MEIINRKAHFNYFIEKEIEAGIALTGTEIKSIRKGSANFNDAFVIIKNGEIFVINMYIAKYDEGNKNNHDERRTRKLLMHKNEIIRLLESTQKDGYTLIPTKLFFKGNNAKIMVGLGKGKKLYDKRETIKKRDLERINKNAY